MSGHKTSVYLPDDLAEAWKASGRSLTDVIRAGLAAAGETGQPVTRAELHAELAPLVAALQPQPASEGNHGKLAECKHPRVGRKQRCPECGGYNI